MKKALLIPLLAALLLGADDCEHHRDDVPMPMVFGHCEATLYVGSEFPADQLCAWRGYWWRCDAPDAREKHGGAHVCSRGQPIAPENTK